jgi:NitT/TauT family transport system substrate-binding protein
MAGHNKQGLVKLLSEAAGTVLLGAQNGMGLAGNIFGIRPFPARLGSKQQERLMESRRSTRLVGWICAVVIALATTPSFAQQKPPQKIRLAVGTTVLNVGYPMLTLAVTLGYWKEEGYDVELLPVGASLQAIQQMVAGNAEFAEVNASVIVQSNVRNDLPVRIVMANGVIDWAVAVDADGPIKSVKDLKGKTLGVFSLATGGIAYLNSYLRANGLDPARDVEMVPLGLGAPPVEALRTNKVQGLLYWAAAVSTFENAGLKLRKLVGDDWRSYPDYSMSTMQATIDKDPAVVIAMARGAAKATVFALANPDCARKLHWARYPSTKPTGADEATLIRWDMNNQQAQLDSLSDGYKLNGGKLWGNVDPAAFDRLVEFMLAAKQIDKTMPAKDMAVGIPEFFTKVNAFDVKAIEDSAKACKFGP